MPITPRPNLSQGIGLRIRKQTKNMKIKTRIKAGLGGTNHNETLVRK